MPSPATAADRRRGLVDLFASSFLFAVMAVLTRHVTQTGVGGAEVALVRFAVGTTACLALWSAGRIAIRPRRVAPLVLRGVLGASAALFYFLSLEHLPVGTTTLLHYSSPIWATLFAALALGERPTRRTVVALVAASVGVVAVVVGQGKVVGGASVWLLVSVATALVSGAAVVAVRAARRHDGAWTVFSFFAGAGVIFTAPPAFVEWRVMTAYQWLVCLTVGGVSLVAQLLMTRALGAVDNATAGIVGNSTILFAMTIGYVIEEEQFTTLTLVGAGLTVAGIIAASTVRKPTS